MASTVLNMYAEAISKKPTQLKQPELGDGETMPNPAALGMFGIKIEQ